MKPEESVRRFMLGDSKEREKAYFCLSAGLEMEGRRDYESALGCYLQAFSLTPEENDIWYFLNNNVGYSLNQLGRYDEAETYCRVAIPIKPARHNAYKNLGVALEGRGQCVAAAYLYVQAIKLRPTDGRALQHLEVLVRDHREIALEIQNIESVIQECRRLVERASHQKFDSSVKN